MDLVPVIAMNFMRYKFFLQLPGLSTVGPDPIDPS